MYDSGDVEVTQAAGIFMDREREVTYFLFRVKAPPSLPPPHTTSTPL